ncbi:very long-chain acyl-CoA synthetase-like isoform X1 [Esox lucius]|uniref:long-chain-fatty-acid--CoA ligase n=2 Tax=Esox lucius TaxID=8010 RepID=A0AAY5KCN2_ESOLU|nr:very long-chain acyl-CoA synthetase-like isoform X1 [Esox lucius]
MSMFLYTILAGLAILPLFLFLRNPYFVQDLRYTITCIFIGLRIESIKRSKPLYTMLDCFLDKVKKHPDKQFIVFEGSCFTYRDVDLQSNKIARALSLDAVLEEGDTVALLMGNEPAYVFAWLALAKLGCAAALLNYNIRSKSLMQCFSCCGAKVLLTSSEFRGVVEEVLPSLREQSVSVFVLGQEEQEEGGARVEGVKTLSSGKIQQASDQPLDPQLRSKATIKSPTLYIYTSGTTGLPKAAVINHERMTLAASMQAIAGVTRDDVIYIYLPLYHTAGFVMGLVGAIERGNTVILRRKFSASQFWDDCRKYNVTVIQYIGEIMRYLCNTPKKDNDRQHKVRLALGNGIRADTWSEFLERFGDIRICECYGATEGNVGFVNYIGKVGAIGRENFIHRAGNPYALIQYDTEREEPVRDCRGFCVKVPKGETGLLVAKISSRAPFSGYAKSPQQTERKKLKDVFVKGDQYFNSGDLLRIDNEGFVYFMDRIGDTFRWKGENVATTEVSDNLIMVECIEEANVYGVKVPGHEGRIGMAALTLKDNMEFDSKATYEHVKTSLPSYSRPRFIRIQNSLDVTGTFKMMKVKLVNEGFNPSVIRDRLFYLEDKEGYIPMTQEIYSSITDGKLRL